MALDITTRQKLIHTCRLIFYGLPIGKNAPHDAPIVGNQSLAQVVINRVESVAKTRDEFKYMIDVITQYVKETEGQTVKKIKLDQTTRSIVSSGLTDQYGFLIKSSNKYKIINNNDPN